MLCCVLVHFGSCIHSGHSAEILWACHVAATALGLGCVIGNHTLGGIGAFCLLVGTPLWALDILCGAPLAFTSIFTHAGGFGVAVVFLQSEVPSGLWWKTTLGLAGLQLVTRCITPVELNINAAFEIYASVAPWFPNYLSYLLSLLGGTLLVFYVLERNLWRIRPRRWPLAGQPFRDPNHNDPHHDSPQPVPGDVLFDRQNGE